MSNELSLKEFVASLSLAPRRRADKIWHTRKPRVAGFCYLRLFPRGMRRELAARVGPFPRMEDLALTKASWHATAHLAPWSVTASMGGSPTVFHVEAAVAPRGSRSRIARIMARPSTFPRTRNLFSVAGAYLLPKIFSGVSHTSRVTAPGGIELDVTLTVPEPGRPGTATQGVTHVEGSASMELAAAIPEIRLLRQLRVMELVRTLASGGDGRRYQRVNAPASLSFGEQVCQECGRVKFNVLSLFNSAVLQYVSAFPFLDHHGVPISIDLFTGEVGPRVNLPTTLGSGELPGIMPGRPPPEGALNVLRAVTFVLPFFCTGVYRLFTLRPTIPLKELDHAGEAFFGFFQVALIATKGYGTRPPFSVKPSLVSPAGQSSLRSVKPLLVPIEKPLCRHATRGPQGQSTELQTPAAAIPDQYGVPAMDPRAAYRRHEHCGGTRCHECNPTTLHGLFPDVLETLLNGGTHNRKGNGLRRATVEMGAAVAFALRDARQGDLVYISGTSSNRLQDWEQGLPGGFDWYVMVVPDDVSYEMVLSKGPRYLPILVPTFNGNNRSLTMWRLAVLAVLPVGLRGVMGNGRVDIVFPTSLDWVPSRTGDAVNPVTWNAYPPCGACFSVVGGGLHGPFLYNEAPWNGGLLVYGADEVAMAMEDATLLWQAGGPWNGLRNLTPDFSTELPGRWSVATEYGFLDVTFPRVDRTALRDLLARARSASLPPAAPSLVDILWASWTRKNPGQFVELKFGEVSGVRVRTPPSQSMEGMVRRMVGPVLWGPLGSRGDVVPVKALAQRLGALGLDVHWMPLCTPDEGKQLLANLEAGCTLRGSKTYLRALTVLSACMGTTISITEMPTADVTYSLQPPSTAVRMPSFALGRVADTILASLFGAATASFRVGAYAGGNWVPRSADGSTFLEERANYGTHPAGIAWGSCSLPRPSIKGAVDIPDGDHNEIFRQYAVVHTHGGAGTVQTAAAAGARVVVHTTILDRDYLDPVDAGVGTAFGSDPDRILLGLARRYPLLYVAYAKLGFTQALDALAWWISMSATSYLWGTVVIIWALWGRMVNLQLGPTPLATLVSVVSGEYVSSVVVAGIIGPVAGHVLESVFEAAGLSKLEAFRVSYELLLKVATSATGLALVSRFGPVSGVFLFLGLRTLKLPVRAMFAMVLAGVSAPASGFSDSMATLRLNAVFVGFVPVVHAGLVSPDRSFVYELRFPGGGNWLGAQAVIGMYPFRLVDGIVFEFGTLLPWSEVMKLPTTRGSYSPFFNCQVALVQHLGVLVPLLGLAGYVLWASALFAAATIGLLVILVGVPAFVILAIPDLFGVGLPFDDGGALTAMMGTWGYLHSRLADRRLPLVSRLLELANGAATGFGSSRLLGPNEVFIADAWDRTTKVERSVSCLGRVRTELIPNSVHLYPGMLGTVLATERFAADVLLQGWSDLELDSGDMLATRAVTNFIGDSIMNMERALLNASSGILKHVPFLDRSTLTGVDFAVADRVHTLLEYGYPTAPPEYINSVTAITLELSEVLGNVTQPRANPVDYDDPVATQSWVVPTELDLEAFRKVCGVEVDVRATEWSSHSEVIDRLVVAALLGRTGLSHALEHSPRWWGTGMATVLTVDESIAICQIIVNVVSFGRKAIPTVRGIVSGTTSRVVVVFGIDAISTFLELTDEVVLISTPPRRAGPREDYALLVELCPYAAAYLHLAGAEPTGYVHHGEPIDSFGLYKRFSSDPEDVAAPFGFGVFDGTESKLPVLFGPFGFENDRHDSWILSGPDDLQAYDGMSDTLRVGMHWARGLSSHAADSALRDRHNRLKISSWDYDDFVDLFAIPV